MSAGSPTKGPRATSLVVGVTGHRDLLAEDLPALADEIDGVLDLLREITPHTEVRIMSGLAEGADLLVAEVALKRDLPVDVVLPMPLEHYEEDFSPEGREALAAVLNNPSATVSELALPPDLASADVASPGPARDRLYAALAEILVGRSTLLLALWDGEVTGLLGGTSDVVLRYLGAPGDLEEFRPVGADDTSIGLDLACVYWIPVRRGSREPLAGPALRDASFLTGDDGSGVVWERTALPRSLEQQLSELDEYNQQFDVLGRPAGDPGVGGLLSGVPLDGEPEAFVDLLARIDEEFQKSDELALYFQRRSDRLFLFFSLAAAAMGVVFLLFAKIWSSNALLFVYLGLFGLGLFAFYVARRSRWLSRHLTYRTVAETMRTRFFLLLADAQRGVRVPELMRTMGTYRLPGTGLISALVTMTQPVGTRARDAAAVGRMTAYVRSAWVIDQSQYFRSKIAKLAHAHHRLGLVRLLLIGAFVAAAIALIAAKDHLGGWTIYEFEAHGDKKADEPISAKTLLVFVMGLLPFLLGVWELHSNKMATKELLWQYRNQADSFALAERELAATSDVERTKLILSNLGRRSLVEGYLWAMHRFHREHEPPAGG